VREVYDKILTCLKQKHFPSFQKVQIGPQNKYIYKKNGYQKTLNFMLISYLLEKLQKNAKKGMSKIVS